MAFYVIINGVKVPVAVSLKKMKQVRLKVFPNGEIKLSAPIGTPQEWIEEYLISKQPWIEEKAELFIQTRAIEKEEHFISGASTRILGNQRTIQIHESRRKQIVLDGETLHVYTSETDQLRIDRQVNNWWQQAAKNYFCTVVDKLYPIIAKHGIVKPEVHVKKMATLWGSCSRKNHKINVNFYLYKASVPCVEYVILHELSHFLYPNHSKDFYDFMTIHMPDWKERKKQLDYDFVLGI